MTMEIINNKEKFDRLVKLGYYMLKLTSQLTPMDTGFNEPDFVYETEYKENQNYGIKGGSIHKSKDGETGKLLLVDFDIKEKYLNEKKEKCDRVIPEAKAQLEKTKKLLDPRDYYFTTTKTGGLHMGILTNENIKQSVS